MTPAVPLRALTEPDILRHGCSNREGLRIDEELISRDEIVALLFNVSDIAQLLYEIGWLLGGGDDAEEGPADGG